MSDVTLETVKRLATRLSQSEKARLVEWLESTPSEETARRTPVPPRQSLYGLCADLGPGPSDDDIKEVRREMWANFPREDIA